MRKQNNCPPFIFQLFKISRCLASMNLPAALDDVTKQEQCPESIRVKSSKVKNSGGINDLLAKISELPVLYKRNEEILNEVLIDLIKSRY
jgi:hypothetical protein